MNHNGSYLKAVEIIENVREQKVEERPQLGEIVLPAPEEFTGTTQHKSKAVAATRQTHPNLQGCAGEEKPGGSLILLELFDQAAVEILQPVPLVHNHKLPGHSLQVFSVIHRNLKTGNDDLTAAKPRIRLSV